MGFRNVDAPCVNPGYTCHTYEYENTAGDECEARAKLRFSILKSVLLARSNKHGNELPYNQQQNASNVCAPRNSLALQLCQHGGSPKTYYPTRSITPTGAANGSENRK